MLLCEVKVPAVAVAATLIARPCVEPDSGIRDTVVGIYFLLMRIPAPRRRRLGRWLLYLPLDAPHSGIPPADTVRVCPAVPIPKRAGVLAPDA
jgi:hypothetical protein